METSEKDRIIKNALILASVTFVLGTIVGLSVPIKYATTCPAPITQNK